MMNFIKIITLGQEKGKDFGVPLDKPPFSGTIKPTAKTEESRLVATAREGRARLELALGENLPKFPPEPPG